MAFNKSKALESALKYLNQGKVNQAIAEYQQILRQDPKDQATLMTVGDLFARQGDMSHALEYFERLAQVYLTDGFNSKAIAIYKKIAKLAPSEIAPLERLADLYVQQGVLSEARPLFLQIAEAHLKANRAPRAVEVLRRLLDVEPENPRVQMRLAELYNVMGQKGDAAKTYLAYAQRLFDRGEAAEAEKLVERALEVVPSDGPALLLKAKIFASSGKEAAAVKLLSKHPEADAGSEVTNLLADLELKTGQIEAAADRARNQLVRGNAHYGLLFRVAENLVETGHPDEALPLFRELRDPMIEVGEHDKFVKSLSAAIEKLPGNTEALELLADFCRHTSDPFPLTVALTKLADVYQTDGNDARAEQVLEELVDRNRDDERVAARLAALRARMGKAPTPEPNQTQQPEAAPAIPPSQAEEAAAEAPPAEIRAEEALDPETQSYVAQALTDVDLFSSYGLTQKAVNLLETILQRAPRHAPTLERLLDLSLGSGNNRRTAELAGTLESVYRERDDRTNAERFAQLRKRYETAAGVEAEASAASPKQSVSSQPQAEIEPAPVEEAAPLEISFAEESDGAASAPEFIIEEPASTQAENEPAVAASPQEVDLSDEWEAMVQEVVEPPAPPVHENPPVIAAPEIEQPLFEIQEAIEIEPPSESESVVAEPVETALPELTPASVSVEPLEFPDIPIPEPLSPEAFVPDTSEFLPEATEFELELTPEVPEGNGKAPATTEEFLADLAGEIEGMEPLEAPPLETPLSFDAPPQNAKPNIVEVPTEPAPAETLVQARSEQAEAAPKPSADLNQLAEVFQDFRSELGELGEEEDEDLETHYNLGIAYREMGLLDEAIGEFQKVAQAVQKGKPFRYTMNCATLLALAFRDKGEPKIASLWYKRALEVPGLDQETVLALRYDLGISLEMAGESEAALDCFRQVYAMNIDYRDVADRIATLQHH
jgi:tetratricopeptide (TPR) repeat protein